MKLGTSTWILSERFGEEKTLRMIADAGFDGVDWDFSSMAFDDNVWNRGDWRERAHRMRALADELGLTVMQAHAPYPASVAAYDDVLMERIRRSMEIASILGAAYIVVHPMKHLDHVKYGKQLFAQNLEMYRSLLPYAEQWNIRVCVENMNETSHLTGRLVNSGCGMPEEFRAMLDSLNSPWAAGCLDTGHAALSGLEPADAICALGHDYLQLLHVHDVDYLADSHTLPYLEKLDWDAVTTALADIGYEGNFVFETGVFFRNIPEVLCPAALTFAEKTGRYLVSEIERKKPCQ
ncbi:MAG: sugar phosphate isomerase/epimerase [Oscillibacter sp.]|nr:sugar phosphate isomerase/epimerase [Oscillibacter sp.]